MFVVIEQDTAIINIKKTKKQKVYKKYSASIPKAHICDKTHICYKLAYNDSKKKKKKGDDNKQITLAEADLGLLQHPRWNAL